MSNKILPLTNSDPQMKLNESQVDETKPFEIHTDKQLRIQKTILDRSAVDELKLEDHLKSTHPTVDDELITCSTCCDIESGFNCCFSVDEHSDLNQYGAGVTIYFRFIKQITIYFCLFTLLSIPQLLFSIWCGKDLYSSNVTLNQGLMMTTIGSLSMQGDSCMKLVWSDVQANTLLTINTATALQKTVLSCNTGKISPNSFIIGFIDAQDSTPCSYQEPTSAYVDCTNQTEYNTIYQQCVGQTSCQFLLTPSLFIDSAQCNQYHSDTYTAYAYSFCQDSSITFGVSQATIENKTLAIVCGYIDLLIVLISAFLIYSLENQDNQTMKYVHESEVFVSSFSLEFSNLPQLPPNVLYKKLISTLEENLKYKYPQIKEFHIVDVQFSIGNDKIVYSQQKQQLVNKRNNLAKKFEIQHNVQLVTSMDLRMNMAASAMLSAIKEIPDHLQNEANEAISKIKEIETQIAEYENKIQQPLKHEEPLKMVWVTFETMEQRNLANYLYQVDYLREAFSCCTDLSLLQLDGQILRAQAAPHPDDINWENLNYTSCELFLRRTVSLLFTMVLIIATISAIIFLKYQQLNYTSLYPEPNCKNYQNLTQQEVVTDYDRTVGKLGLVQCYCKEDLINRINLVFPNNQQLCRVWLDDQIKVMGWPFLIVVVIIIINTIIQFIFTKFAEFEGHRSRSKQLSSRLLKIFLVQFINTALVILIINIRFANEINASTFTVLLNGKFDDITVQWFLQVGTTILLTMFIYVIAPLFQLFTYYLIRYIKKSLDTCCLDANKFTRKITQEELNNYYTGPEFNIELRYATVLTIISVNYIYGSGLPALYFSTTLFLFLTFWIDKYIMLTFCKIPQKIDDSLANVVRWILKFLLIWHTIFAIWIYGSTKLFPETVNFTQSISQNSLVTLVKDNYLGEFFQRGVTSQCIGLLVMLFLMIAVYILWPFVVSPVLKTIFFFCFSDSTLFNTVENTIFSAQQSIYELFSQEQCERLIHLFKKDINRERVTDKEYCEYKKKRISLLQEIQNHKGAINGICSYSIFMNQKYAQYQQ